MHAPPQSKRDQAAEARSFLPRLEAMRGYAAVSVLAFHACMLSWSMIAGGMAPVVVFFVLSGFLLGRSLERDPDPVTFIRHRLFRLLPAAIVTVLLLTLAYRIFGFYVGYLPSFEPLNVILNALLIKSDINGVMWSLTVESVAVPVILLAHALLGSRGRGAAWILVVVLIAISSWGPYVHLLGGFTNLSPLYAFIVGLLVQAGANFNKQMAASTPEHACCVCFRGPYGCGDPEANRDYDIHRNRMRIRADLDRSLRPNEATGHAAV